MSILTRTGPCVKPSQRRPFAEGLIDPATDRIIRPEPYTAADTQWWAAQSEGGWNPDAATPFDLEFWTVSEWDWRDPELTFTRPGARADGRSWDHEA